MTELDLIAERKRALVERADLQRNDLLRVCYGWQARRMAARQVAGILKNPLVMAGIGFVLLKLPWRRVYKMGGWGWKLWRVLRLVRRLI